MNSSTTEINELLSKMIVQLSGAELCTLTRYAAQGLIPASSIQQPIQAVGIHQLADALGCSVSYLYAIKAKGILNNAIISHIGKKVVFNVEKARELASNYQESIRAARK